MFFRQAELQYFECCANLYVAEWEQSAGAKPMESPFLLESLRRRWDANQVRNVVYEQIFDGVSGKESYSDSIGFWYKTTAPPSTAANIEGYMHQHNMHFGLELARTPGQSWVDAIYSDARPKLAGFK
jgi:hypothetical protein